MKTITLLSSTWLAASALYAQAPESAKANKKTQHYTITDLGPVGAPPGQPIIIKKDGMIAGSAAVSDTAWHSMIWYDGAKIDIGSPGLGGPSNIVYGANDRGELVGQAETDAHDPDGEDFCGFGSTRICVPFVWRHGVMSALPTLGGKNGGANSINNHGEIAGLAENTQADFTCPAHDPTALQYQKRQFKPVVWQNGKIQELPTPPGDPDGIAFSINDHGQVVGGTGTCTGYQALGDLTYLFSQHAVIWETGTVTDLGNLGSIADGGGNTPVFINNHGQVVGASGTADGSLHGFLWTRETGIQDVGTLDGDVASVALSISDKGDIVGLSFDPNFNARAFIRRDGGDLVDLNTLASADNPLFLFHACSINAQGEIIGMAADMDGNVHGYLATPSDGAVSANSAERFTNARRLLQQRMDAGPFRLHTRR